MQIFCAPAVLDKRRRQKIQQGPVHRLFCPHTEVSGRANKALAEMMQPETIDIDADGERILRAGNGLSQFQSSAAIHKWRCTGTAQDFQEVTRHLLAGRARIAAKQNVRIGGVSAVGDGHRAWRRAGMRPIQGLNSVADWRGAFAELSGQNGFSFSFGQIDRRAVCVKDLAQCFAVGIR